MLDEYYQFRRHLVDALERDLLGPGADDEVITDPPTMKYIVGVLFPRDSDRTDPAQDLGEGADSDADADDSESWDPAVSMSYVRYPCSMGMTMAVDSTATQRILVAAARSTAKTSIALPRWRSACLWRSSISKSSPAHCRDPGRARHPARSAELGTDRLFDGGNRRDTAVRLADLDAVDVGRVCRLRRRLYRRELHLRRLGRVLEPDPGPGRCPRILRRSPDPARLFGDLLDVGLARCGRAPP